MTSSLATSSTLAQRDRTPVLLPLPPCAAALASATMMPLMPAMHTAAPRRWTRLKRVLRKVRARTRTKTIVKQSRICTLVSVVYWYACCNRSHQE